MPVLTVLLLSLGLHAAIGWSLAADLSAFGAGWGRGVWALLLLSAVLLPAGFLMRRRAGVLLGRVLNGIGFAFMGLFSSLFVFTMLRELVLLPAMAWSWIRPAALDLAAWRSDSAAAVAMLALAVTAWGYLNARRTATVVRIDIPVPGLPEALHGFSMAQISDIHVGPTIRTRYLQRIVARVNQLDADLVAITGDLVDGSVRDLAGHVEPLRGLSSTHGTFFVTGNHEYYSGVEPWLAVLRGLGVQVLLNEHVVIHHHNGNQDTEHAMVVVAGVTDFGAHHFDESHRSDPHRAIADAPLQAVFKLLLAHQPRSAPMAAAAGFDLQLSGHTHGGQFWPWNHFVRLQQPFTAGLHRLQTLWVYTSRGTGYWGPPKRFGAPSEITHLRLVPAPS